MFTVEIDLDHIEKGLEGIKKYSKMVEQAMDDALIELYVKTDDKLIDEISSYGLSESRLGKTKYIDIEEDYFEIGLNSDYAEFVEYGTGIEGFKEQHPDPYSWSEFYGYDVHDHGEKGWKYPKEDGTYGWTRGMPSRPMVYNTKQYLQGQATRTFRKHLLKINGVHRSK